MSAISAADCTPNHGTKIRTIATPSERTGDWIAAADGKQDRDKIYGDYGATVDYPGCAFWNELADDYPDAKIILTDGSLFT